MIYISLLLGFILRIYLIGSNFYFTGELGKELIYVRSFLLSGGLPQTGLPTSHEWLTYGPVYYWILIPLIKVFGQNPFILFWLALAVSIIGIYITYLVFSKVVDKKFATILSFFISLSPIWIYITRLSKLHTFFFLLIPFFIFCLYKIWNRNPKYTFWLGLTLGLLFSFHFSQLPLFAVIFTAFYIKRKYLKIKDYAVFLLGLILPNITVLAFDAKNGFTMLKNLISWIPYRFAGFLGIYPKNNLDAKAGINTLSSFNDFFGRSLFWDERFWILGSVIFISLFVIYIIQNGKKIGKDFFTFYLIVSTLVQGFALLIHTNPPIHYFLPIFLNLALIFSYFVSFNWKRKTTQILTILIFALMFVSGFLGVKKEHANNPDFIPIKTQERAVDSIIESSQKRPFSLIRLGPFDYFPENYSQNYQYLIWVKGGQIDQSAKLRYIIYDIGDVYVEKYE